MDFSFLKDMSFAQFISFLICVLPLCYATWIAFKKKVQALEDKFHALEQSIALEKQQSRLENDFIKQTLKEVKDDQDKLISKIDVMINELRADIKELLKK
ncbi:hypothetical protein CF138_17330 [Aeromonas hydrophila]|uniref:hypothetical protein n=1 Tax=Aeromonas TaxID=642 RepID=UPI0011175570|nr:hypothetical protein [Aeromonas hydrophila]TNH82863.1 hypothetical protein CF138_17330 [Aeromonas hydrophila]TNI00248.1 hypothetical protein CF136_10635 [Aeromonas hydrophila]TNI92871.1 hypothetical protein CF118_18005 [Aeromonas hydrophila]